MSIRMRIAVQCDQQGCTDAVTSGSSLHVANVRLKAQHKGWSYVGGLDLCPKHSEPVPHG